ncbi:MAG: hypothetical protein AAFV07_17505 [Bacteroidota bacterium]
MDKVLYVKGIGGLGNRLQSLCVAIEYAQRTGRAIFVDWRNQMYSSDGENVFYKYFRLTGIDQRLEEDGLNALDATQVFPPPYAGKLHLDVYELYKQKAWHRFFPKDVWIPKDQEQLQSFWDQLSLYLKRQMGRTPDLMPAGCNLSPTLSQQLVVFTDYEPLFSADIFRNHIRLSEEMEAELTAFTDRNFQGKQVIGIHVRNTDRKPLGSFDVLIKAAQERLESDGKIFVASDDAGIFDRFKEVFGEARLLQTPKFIPADLGGRGLHAWSHLNESADTAERVFRESILDMWLLGMTDYLFYQGNSSFSRISRCLMKHPGQNEDWNLLRD